METTINPQDNFEDITDGERIVKYSVTLSVRGFLLAPQGAGQRVPFKRYLSSVNISFETVLSDGVVAEKKDIDSFNETKEDLTKDNSFILTDLEVDPSCK